MVAQVNKIIANAIIQNQAVALPTIGSLYVDSVAAKIKSSSVMPPRYIVRFTSQMRGVALPQLISQVGRCDATQAEEIYKLWMDASKSEKGIEIGGVGVIVAKNFNIKSQFDSVLNPDVYKELQLKRRVGGWIWIAGSIVGCVVVGLLANYFIGSYLSERPISEPMPEPIVAVEPVVDSIMVEPEVDSTVVERVDTIQRQECVAAPESDDPIYRVVYGVFSSEENAQKAAKMAYATNSDVIARIRPFGEKFMVSIFESDDVEPSKEFIERNKEIYTDLWINKRRGE